MVIEVPFRPAERRGSWLDRFIPRPLRGESGSLYRSRLFLALYLVIMSLGLGSFLGLSFLRSESLDQSFNPPVYTASLCLYLFTAYAFYSRKSLLWAVHGLLTSVFLAVFGVALVLVLKYQLLTYMLLPIPVIAFILGGRWAGVTWTVVMLWLQLTLVFAYQQEIGAGFDFGAINPVIGERTDFIVNMVVIILVIACCITYEVIVGKLQQDLEREKSHFVHLANHDSLTELPNRLAFETYTRSLMVYCDKSGDSFALVYLDVDNFKQVNDSFGHQVGDDVLRAIGSRLKQAVRGGDYVCRLAGDEFAIVLAGLGDGEMLGKRIELVERKLHQDISIGEAVYRPEASFGAAVYPRDAHNYADLLSVADLAMYRNKSSRRQNMPTADSSPPARSA